MTTVRPATQEDVAVLARLNGFVHGPHVEGRPDFFQPPSDKEKLASLFHDFLSGEDALAFIAEAEEEARPVGYVTATIHHNPGSVLTRPRSFAFVEHIAVDPEHAREGIGAALVEAVRTAGKDAGCTTVLTDVWDFNKTALAFFDGLGFVPMRHWLERSL